MAGRFSVEAVFKAVDRVTAPVTRMQNRIGKMTRSVERGLRNIDRRLSKITSGFRRFASSALKIGTGAVIAGVTALTFALNGVADAADRLAKQSRRLQFPIEDLQEWKFVAEQSGVGTDLLDKSLGAFTKRLGEAKGGMGPLVTGLKNINPELLKQLNATESVAEAFEIYIGAIRNAKSATEKAALANAAFSRAGLELVNIADNSSDAIKALRTEQRLNGNVTMEQAEAAEAYNDAVNSLQRSLTGLLQGVLLPMMPAITETVKRWREWVLANKEMTSKNVLTFFDDMKTKIKNIITAVREFNEEYNIGEIIRDTVEVIKGAKNFLVEHGATIGKITLAVVAFSVVLKTLVGVLTLVNLVMALNPIGLIVIGVLAAVAAFTALVVWIDDVADAFENLTPFVRFLLSPLEAVVKTIKFIKDNISVVTGAAAKLQEMSLGEIATGAVTGPASLLRDFFSDDDTADTQPSPTQVVTPQERTARSIEETRNTSTAEVTIKDDTGRAEVTGGKLGAGLKMQSTGAFN